ncbi:hypothetical protein B0O99DRAFT_649603 [Bisporella sp. PMI_857]|nr:hypothetical protein B0O99DRAFT_649603 [Bisporella sp. PMI_857]
MGPPSKPADKGSKDDGVDPMDVLGGTGVDLREEEQYQFRSYNLQQTGSQSGFISQGHGFAQFPPGNAASFYGAGPANVNGEAPGNASQEEFEIQAAKQAFESASRNLATSRKNELSNPFLSIGRLHSLLLKSSHENGLGLNLERNPQNGNSMGHFKLPEQYDNNRVDVKTSVVPNGAFTATNGNFLPADSYLCDQIALLSLATKHRLRSLVSDAARLSKERQRSSHGVVPEEWSDAAAPNDAGNSGAVAEGAVRGGWESAVSPLSNSRKPNKIPTPISEGMKTPIEPLKFKNVVVTALRSSAQKERDFEEERIRKRNERAAPKRNNERKPKQKTNEAANHVAANTTTAQFLGGGRKKYSWMTGGGGGSGSGTNTPGRIITKGLTPGAAGAIAAPEKLTVDGVRRLGMWREDKRKEDGREKKALQKAYAWLDHMDPK